MESTLLKNPRLSFLYLQKGVFARVAFYIHNGANILVCILTAISS